MSKAHRTSAWATHARKARAQLAAAQAPCSACHRPIDWDADGRTRWGGTVAHPHALALGGDLLPPIDSLTAMHRYCAGLEGATLSNHVQGVGPGSRGGNPKTYTRPKRKQSAEKNGAVSYTPSAVPLAKSWAYQKMSPNNALEYADDLPALHDEGWTLPRLQSEPRPGTDYDMADELLEWVDANAPGDPLFGWQRWAWRRIWETAGGRLWGTVLILMSRQQGKTYLVRRVLLTRVRRGPELFGQRQTVLNTAPSYRLAEDLMEPWARALIERGEWGRLRARSHAVDWWLDGREEGSRWLVRALRESALRGVPGVTCAFVDEVQSATYGVRRSLRPTMSGARLRNTQLLAAGTAALAGAEYVTLHEQSRLLREMRALALAGGDVLLLEWSVPSDADVSDERMWRWASPDWSDARLEFLRSEAGAATFPSEYLLLHQEVDDGEAAGAALVDADVWDSLLSAGGVPVAVGVESEQGGLPVVAVVSRGADGALVVGVRQAGSMVEAVDWCRQVGCQPQVGKSLLHDPGWRDLGAVGMSGTAGELCGAFQQLVADRVIAHDGGDVLSGQVRGAAVRPLAGGRIGVSGRVDAVKATVWAVGAARSAPPRPRIW